MKHIPYFLLSCFIVISLHGFIQPNKYQLERKLYTIAGKAQGTTYTIKYVYHDSLALKASIDSLLFHIDNSLSLYKSTSLISQFNASEKGIPFDDHLKRVVSSSIEYSLATMHSFDITSKPISLLWGFNTTAERFIPNNDLIKATLKHIGSHYLFFRNDSLLKTDPKTMIDCDGIAQGYSVDQLSYLLKNRGITDFVVELGGEIFTSGNNIDGKKWIVGIEEPAPFSGDDHFVAQKVSLSGFAITTSGSLKKFRKLGNRYFSHIMDPRTGFPVNNGIISVTVIARTAIAADAYDNAFAVMGLQASIAHIKPSDSLGIYMVYSKPDGSLADTSNAYFLQFVTR